MNWFQTFVLRRCSGEGEQTEQIREVDVRAPVASYVGRCPECGKMRPATGRGFMLRHRR